MPELPEVEIVKRGLEPVLLASGIRAITVKNRSLRKPIPANFARDFSGAMIKRVIRRGKYIIALADNGRGFVLHLGMSGRIKIYRFGQSYKPEKHDHVSFEMKDGGRIVFNDPRRFGMLYSVRADRWAAEPPFDLMGPEPLDKDFSGAVLRIRLKGRRGPVKTALLDQNVVAGVGNIYACEALYMARIGPERPAGGLDGNECERLVKAICVVLAKAIEAGGSSLKDYRHPDDGLGYFQHLFAVYDREGAACSHCDCDVLKTGGVRRIVQAGRSTFFCQRRQLPDNSRKKKQTTAGP